ncbi:CSC1-like protein [Drosera capensis]
MPDGAFNNTLATNGGRMNMVDLQGHDLSVYPLSRKSPVPKQKFDFAQYYAFNLTIFALTMIYSSLLICSSHCSDGCSLLQLQAIFTLGVLVMYKLLPSGRDGFQLAPLQVFGPVNSCFEGSFVATMQKIFIQI